MGIFSISRHLDQPASAYKTIPEIIAICIFKSKTVLRQSNFQRLPPAVNKIFYRYIYKSNAHRALFSNLLNLFIYLIKFILESVCL